MAPRVFFVLFNSNRQVALGIDVLLIVACGHMYFHGTVRNRTALDGTTQFDVYSACICANYRLSAHVLTFVRKLLIYCRLAADVRVWRRCSVVGCCRPDVEGGPLIRSVFRPKNLLSGLFAN